MKVILCCSAAMSSNLIAEKLKIVAQKREYEFEIYPLSQNELQECIINPDIILITPQLKYARRKIEKHFAPIPILEISMRDYGMMDGEAIFQKILNTINS